MSRDTSTTVDLKVELSHGLLAIAEFSRFCQSSVTFFIKSKWIILCVCCIIVQCTKIHSMYKRADGSSSHQAAQTSKDRRFGNFLCVTVHGVGNTYHLLYVNT